MILLFLQLHYLNCVLLVFVLKLGKIPVSVDRILSSFEDLKLKQTCKLT